MQSEHTCYRIELAVDESYKPSAGCGRPLGIQVRSEPGHELTGIYLIKLCGCNGMSQRNIADVPPPSKDFRLGTDTSRSDGEITFETSGYLQAIFEALDWRLLVYQSLRTGRFCTLPPMPG
jgi:hypothetical protein